MIALVTGGREYRDRRELYGVLDKLHAERSFKFLVHGGARGADRMAHKWAKERGVQPVAMEALWDTEGDPAGTNRNLRMYEFAKPELIIAFSGGRGTANMMKVGYDAKRAGDPVEIIDVEDLSYA
ncbi:hypothetical protein [Phaeobacter phage MD18]|nr:hypothetical protein [Phaeobacter phage MD18]